MSPKHCPKCHKQGRIVDSRHGKGYVRRMYWCRDPACGHKWTTAEFVVEEGATMDKRKVARYVQREERNARMRAIDKLQGALDKLRNSYSSPNTSSKSTK